MLLNSGGEYNSGQNSEQPAPAPEQSRQSDRSKSLVQDSDGWNDYAKESSYESHVVFSLYPHYTTAGAELHALFSRL